MKWQTDDGKWHDVKPVTDEARRRQAEEEVAAAEMRRHKLEQEAAAEQVRREMLAERKRRIFECAKAALTGLLWPECETVSEFEYAVRRAAELGRMLVDELDKEAQCS